MISEELWSQAWDVIFNAREGYPNHPGDVRTGVIVHALSDAGLLCQGCSSEISQELHDKVWQVIADVRDVYPRVPHDAPTDEIVEALVNAGLICGEVAQP